MNTTANICDRCQFHIEGNICGQCGKCDNIYHQYCDMCCNVIYSGNVNSHDCREKETGTITYIREVPPDLRPKGVIFRGFICECDTTLPLNALDEHLSECKVAETVKCYMCKCAMKPEHLRTHVCVVNCHICHKIVSKNKLHKHRCMKQQFMVHGYSTQVQLDIRKCRECDERISLFGHECKKVVSCANKIALCLRCNSDITTNWRDHTCNIGDSYIEVRCADCAQIRTTMMFRYHTCKAGPKSKCNQCGMELQFNHILQHACNSGIPVHKIFTLCYGCEKPINYLKLHSHGQNCTQLRQKVGKKIAMCFDCGDEMTDDDIYTHKCYRNIPHYNIKVMCNICVRTFSAFNIAAHSIHCASTQQCAVDTEDAPNAIIVDDGNDIECLFNNNIDDNTPIMERRSQEYKYIFSDTDNDEDDINEFTCVPYTNGNKIYYSDEDDENIKYI